MSLTLGIRLHKKSSIYRRITDLIKSGVLDYDNRPLWYDVYEAHPPMREPIFVPDPGPNEFGLPDTKDDVRPILYSEDWARSVAYQKFKSSGTAEISPLSDLFPKQRTNHIQKFLEVYKEVERREPELSKTAIYMKAEKEIAPMLNELFEKGAVDKQKHLDRKAALDEDSLPIHLVQDSD